MKNNDPVVVAMSALRGPDSLALRQVFRSVLDEVAVLRTELEALRSVVAAMKKPGDK
jgi:hypothetical protein